MFNINTFWGKNPISLDEQVTKSSEVHGKAKGVGFGQDTDFLSFLLEFSLQASLVSSLVLFFSCKYCVKIQRMQSLLKSQKCKEFTSGS